MPGDGGDSSTWAILVAAGSGERLGADRPKAFVALGGRVLLAESLERLDGSAWIDAVVVAVPADWEEAAIVLAEELVASKVAAVVTGGATRAESVRAALEEIPDDALVVIVHDAARPLVDDAVIERVIAPLAEGYDGVVPGLAARRHGQARRGRGRRRDRRPWLARHRADAAGIRSDLAPGRLSRHRADRCLRLRVARRGAWRQDPGRRGRSPAAEGHDGGRSRARRIVALKAVFFDVGETLVDEERWWRMLAERSGLQPHVVWAALGVTIERGEEHNELWRHLGRRAADVLGLRPLVRARRPVSGRDRLPRVGAGISACGSASSATSRS